MLIVKQVYFWISATFFYPLAAQLHSWGLLNPVSVIASLAVIAMFISVVVYFCYHWLRNSHATIQYRKLFARLLLIAVVMTVMTVGTGLFLVFLTARYGSLLVSLGPLSKLAVGISMVEIFILTTRALVQIFCTGLGLLGIRIQLPSLKELLLYISSFLLCFSILVAISFEGDELLCRREFESVLRFNQHIKELCYLRADTTECPRTEAALAAFDPQAYAFLEICADTQYEYDRGTGAVRWEVSPKHPAYQAFEQVYPQF